MPLMASHVINVQICDYDEEKKKDAYAGILRDAVADSFIPIVCFVELINLSLLME